MNKRAGEQNAYFICFAQVLKVLIVFFLWITCVSYTGQADTGTQLVASAIGFSESTEAVVKHQYTANLILGTWSLGSVAAGVFQLFSRNPFVKAFGMQNLAWGSIDGTIAFFGHRSLQNVAWETTTPLAEKLKFRKVLLINSLLDFLYLAVGFLLLKTKNVKWHGHGVGIIFQGFFLFLFDWINFALTF